MLEVRYGLFLGFSLIGLGALVLILGRTKNPLRGEEAQPFSFKDESSVSSSSPPEYKEEEEESLPELDLKDIFISVKTSYQFHKTRVPVLLDTWFNLARKHIWFFTDRPDPLLTSKTNGHLKVTNCGTTHQRQDLCCKMGAEFDAFVKSGRKWFCHFDDDNYVNVFALLRMLQNYDYKEDVYLGKPSLPGPFDMMDRENNRKQIRFRFGTGGAGFCLSQSLGYKMIPVAGEGRFSDVAEKIRLPDDVTMGYISEILMNTPLTVIEEFHSHLEPQRFFDVENDEEKFRNQISFGYHRYDKVMNSLNIQGIFDEQKDPSRFLSLHCKLFPNFNWCPAKKKKTAIRTYVSV